MRDALHNSINVKCPEQAHPQQQKADYWLYSAGGMGEKWGLSANRQAQGFFLR